MTEQSKVLKTGKKLLPSVISLRRINDKLEVSRPFRHAPGVSSAIQVTREEKQRRN